MKDGGKQASRSARLRPDSHHFIHLLVLKYFSRLFQSVDKFLLAPSATSYSQTSVPIARNASSSSMTS